jgi:hypothetical protein
MNLNLVPMYEESSPFSNVEENIIKYLTYSVLTIKGHKYCHAQTIVKVWEGRIRFLEPNEENNA